MKFLSDRPFQIFAFHFLGSVVKPCQCSSAQLADADTGADGADCAAAAAGGGAATFGIGTLYKNCARRR